MYAIFSTESRSLKTKHGYKFEIKGDDSFDVSFVLLKIIRCSSIDFFRKILQLSLCDKLKLKNLYYN